MICYNNIICYNNMGNPSFPVKLESTVIKQKTSFGNIAIFCVNIKKTRMR